MALVTKKDRFTSVKKQPVYYSDFPSTMEKAIGSNELLHLQNIDAVKNSIRNIVLTNRGERFFNYDFGCDVRALLVENIEPSTESAIKTLIETSDELDAFLACLYGWGTGDLLPLFLVKGLSVPLLAHAGS